MASQRRRTLFLLFHISLFFCLLAPVYAQTQYGLVINVIPSDGGTVKADCLTPCQYNADSWAHLLAIPNSGYVFNYWDVDCTGGNPSVAVMMSGLKTCNANFLPCNTVTPFKMGASYYGSFLEAYELAAGGETIDVLATTIQESLRLDRLIPVTLKGGYRCWGESTPSSYTLLQGQMIFKEGAGTVENLMILSGTPPVITSFEAIPSSISSGGTSTLYWTVADAAEVSIDSGIGTVDPINGSVIVSPSATTTYTMTAANSYGTVKAQVIVNVLLPEITTFKAAPDVISPGGSSTLTWAVTDATSVSIDQGIGTVNPSDTTQVSPTSTTVYTITAVKGAVTVTRTITVGVIPPDPATMAPPIDQTVATTVYDASSFLYTGTTPVQTGMAPETIDVKRVAVLKGKVMDRSNYPLSGVTIAILNHPEYGQTITRPDGLFDIAVNGGGYLTVSCAKSGYLAAHRQVNVPWQDYASLPDVIMIPVDTQVTTIDLTKPDPIQVARGSVVTDNAGPRQGTIFFPTGTAATLVNPDGSTQGVSTLNVRVTEYTVGSNGPKAMPAELPPTSGYTYCVELSADEAISAGAQSVQFSQPVAYYVENYLYAAVGSVVPVGYYDRTKGVWIPSDNGRVIKIVSISGGLAEVDTDGDGVADNGLGINDIERQHLATLYTASQELWRVPISHLTPWDCNWPYGPPPDAQPPKQPPPEKKQPQCQNEEGGSIIGCQNQTLGEAVDLVGTPFRLHYQSNRVPGRKADYSLEIPLSGDTVPGSLIRIELVIYVAGRKFTQSFTNTHLEYPSGSLGPCPPQGNCPPPIQVQGNVPVLTNLKYVFTWDGKDAYNRSLIGPQPITVRIGYTYWPVYMQPGNSVKSFASFSGVPITGSGGFSPFTFWQEWSGSIGPWDARGQGLDGWTLSIHHAYDPVGQTLFLGNGDWLSASGIGKVITTVAGTGTSGSSGDGGPATQAQIGQNVGVAVSQDGTLYIADPLNHRIRRVGTDGIITTVAGNGSPGCGWGYLSPPCFSGDGGLATEAKIKLPYDVAVSPDGTLYIADFGNNRIRRVGTDGIISTVAGNGVQCNGMLSPCGDDGPAADAQVSPWRIAVGADGSIYFSDARVRRIRPDGVVSTVAGGAINYGCGLPGGNCGMEGPATQATLQSPAGLAVGRDGTLFIADPGSYTVRRVSPDGIIHFFAGGFWQTQGGCSYEPCGDGGQAFDATIGVVEGVAVGPDNYVYLVGSSPSRVRRVSPGEIITGVAGNGKTGCYPTTGSCGDGGPATAAALYSPFSVAAGPDGSIYVGDNTYRIRRVASVFPGMGVSDTMIPSEDGSEIYVFNSAGRHSRTLNALTSSVLYQFGYDTAGLLISITDGNGNVTTIERDLNNNPMAIIAPFGQQTALTVNADGYLATVVNPAGETYQLSYTNDGLLTSLTDPIGYVHNYTYDNLGLLVKDADPAGGSQSLSRTEATTNYQVDVTTDMGRKTSYLVENLSTDDQQQTNTFPDGANIITLNKKDGSTMLTLPDGTVMNSMAAPDPRFGMQSPLLKSMTATTPGGLSMNVTENRTVSLSDPANPLSLTSLTDTFSKNGQTYTMAYSAATKTFTNTTPIGRQSTQTIDSLGRVVQSQLSGVSGIQYSYDSNGRLLGITQGAGTEARTYTLQYNSEGYLQSITDPLSNVLGFQYDQAGRVTKQVLPDGRQILYSFDSNGNVTSITPPGRPSHSFTYSPVDLMLEYDPPAIGLPTSATQYNYNVDKQITQMLRPDGQTIAFNYDAGGRLSTVTSPDGSVTYAYDPSKGYITGINLSGGNSLSYTYDGLLVTGETWGGDVSGSLSWTHDNNFRVTGVSISGGSAISYQYDNDGLITQAGTLTLTRSSQNGLLTGSTLGNVSDTWTYGSFGEPTNYTASYNAASIFSQQLSYDKLGRITSKTETISGVTNTYGYIYDAASRLTTVKQNNATFATYAYDSNGNRLSYAGIGGTFNGAYDDQDRLTQYGSANYSYTANGDLKSKTANGQTTLYNYDAFGNLKSVTLPGGALIEYAVDGRNRPIGKKLNGAWVRKLVYRNSLKPVAELDAGNNVISVFIYGSRLTTPDYMIKVGTTYRIVSDQLGSPRLVVDIATGNIVQRMDYDEFGNVINDTYPGFQPFGFAGGLYDKDTGFVRFGTRDYYPEAGRWTTKDPVGFSSGPNLYSYAYNDPVNLIDPLGDQPVRPPNLWTPPNWWENPNIGLPRPAYTTPPESTAPYAPWANIPMPPPDPRGNPPTRTASGEINKPSGTPGLPAPASLQKLLGGGLKCLLLWQVLRYIIFPGALEDDFQPTSPPSSPREWPSKLPAPGGFYLPNGTYMGT